MNRKSVKMRDAFPKSATEYTQPVEQLLHQRRAEVDAEWAGLEEGWTANNERMARLKVRPRNDEESMVRLNAGGLKMSVWWHHLAGAEGFEDSTLFALLEGVWDEGRIPRDADGHIVLDESPPCMNLIFHTMLRDSGSGSRSSKRAKRGPETPQSSAMAIEELPGLIYTAHVMGLPGCVPTHPKFARVSGGSTILEPFEIAPLGAKIREWVGGSTEEMTLIYRATRDGFDTKSFKPACDEHTRSHVVSLIRVSSGQGNVDDSIVGGYSVLLWDEGAKTKQTLSVETFLFMLKDGSSTGKDPSKPIKWSPHPTHVGKRFTISERCGVCVGVKGLSTFLHKKTEGCTLSTRRDTCDIEEDFPFLALHQKKVVDVEVYSYSNPAPPTAIVPSTTEPVSGVPTDAESHDIRLFGESIANSLMEERVVLDRAIEEMEAADERVSAAVGAVQTVYGPSVAAGEQDTVVELNVRGVRKTTLLSTLQACQRSTLAAMFNEDRWPAIDKDKDEHGRRLLDCNPTCFSKILDVLRMRKRASWNRGVEGGKQQEEEEEEEEDEVEKENEEKSSIGGSGAGAVLIKEADMETFGKTVNMCFPGCEGFIMDVVQSV